jgi:hypothetical protein
MLCGVAGGTPRGTFCYTIGGRGRRLEEVTDTLDLQRLLEETVLYIPRGEYIGNAAEAIQVAKMP